MDPADLVNKLNGLEDDEKPAYYTYIAKAALWLVSAVLLGVVAVGSYRAVHLACMHDGFYSSDIVANVIAASQALGVICLAVLGYRRGGRRRRK